MSSSEIIQRNHLQRNVSGVGATSPPGRALNLHALWLRPPADPDFRTRPFFSNPILNRAIITKHNVRPD